jgi:hypothetical protein
MAVSNETSFVRTAGDLITDALELLGVLGEEEPLTAVDLQRGLKWLNYLLKAWQPDGVMTWTLTEGGPFTLTQGDFDIDFAAGGDVEDVPLDIQSVRVTRSGGTIPMSPLSREDYFNLPNRTAQGYPTQYYYDKQRDSGVLYLYQAPNAVLTTIEWTQRRPIMILTAANDSIDVPEEWDLALVSGLASLLIPIYGKSGTPRAADIRAQAGEAYSSVKAFDIDEGESSIFMVPASYSRPR